MAQDHWDAQRSDPWLRRCSTRSPLGHSAAKHSEIAESDRGNLARFGKLTSNSAEHRRATHLREAKGSQGATWKFSPAAAGKVSSRVIQVTVNGQALGYKSCRNSSGDNPHCFAMVAHCISVDWVSTRDLDRPQAVTHR